MSRRPSLPDIATAIMICDAINMIPGFAVTWGYDHLGDDGRAYDLARRTHRKATSWPDAATKLRQMQHRRLAALAKAINARSRK